MPKDKNGDFYGLHGIATSQIKSSNLAIIPQKRFKDIGGLHHDQCAELQLVYQNEVKSHATVLKEVQIHCIP